MSKRTLSALLALNLFLLGGQLVRPSEAAAEAALFDCCQKSNDGPRFCCDQCCWFGEDCDKNEDCKATDEEAEAN